jgi:hypothetical protein
MTQCPYKQSVNRPCIKNIHADKTCDKDSDKDANVINGLREGCDNGSMACGIESCKGKMRLTIPDPALWSLPHIESPVPKSQNTPDLARENPMFRRGRQSPPDRVLRRGGCARVRICS